MRRMGDKHSFKDTSFIFAKCSSSQLGLNRWTPSVPLEFPDGAAHRMNKLKRLHTQSGVKASIYRCEKSKLLSVTTWMICVFAVGLQKLSDDLLERVRLWSVLCDGPGGGTWGSGCSAGWRSDIMQWRTSERPWPPAPATAWMFFLLRWPAQCAFCVFVYYTHNNRKQS